MTIAKDRVVSIDYTLTNASNRVLDSSAETGPLSYLHGHENIISGLEKALEGKAEGDAFKVKVLAADAYGERNEAMVKNVPLEQFPGTTKVEAGMEFEAETEGGPLMVTVTKVDAGMATVDGNHPLAGMDLYFDVKIAAIRAASAEELEHGHPHHEHVGCNCGGDCAGDGEASGCGCGGCR